MKKAEKVKPPAIKPIPTASYLGWKQVSGWTEDDVLTREERNQDLLDVPTILEGYLPDKFYGQWYHSAGFLAVGAFLSWLVGRLGLGIAWVFLILLLTAPLYRTSVRRERRDIRENVARESAMRKLETDTETLDWINCLLVKFWAINEPFISEMVVQTANKVLADSAPKFLKSLALDTFTLGTKPPRLNHVRTFPKTDEDVVVMDWAYSFTPTDNFDKTARQLKNYVNPLIQLDIGLGAGPVSVKFPIVVRNMAFSGLMRVRIKLVTAYPHIKTVDVSFQEPPKFDYIMKPFGGDSFGFDINVLPGFERFVKGMVDSIMGPMLYAPNSFQVNVQELLAGEGADSAVGVIAVTVFGANGLKGSEAIGNTVDPYILFSLNNRNELARSEVKKSTKNPVWNETKYVLVQNLSEALTMAIYDFNDFRKDKLIGVATHPLESFITKPDQENISLELLDGRKSRGSMNCEMHWFPVLEGKKSPDGTIEPPPESNTGIVKLTVHQAKELDSSLSVVGQLTPYADILMNGKLQSQSKPVKRNNNPVWDYTHEFLVPDRRACKVGVRIKDSRGLSTDPVLCTFQGKLDTILSELKQGNDWFNLGPKGKVRLSATWKPLALRGASATKSYVEPIGTIRLHCIKTGENLRNLETIGKVDPYVRVFMNGTQRARTYAIPNTLDPKWDEVLYIPVQSPDQRMVIEAMDVENLGSDRTLGQFELNTSQFIKANEKGEYIEYHDETVKTGQFVMKKKGPKGTLLYTLSFYPSVNVLSPEEAAELRKEKEEKEKEKEKAEAEAAKSGKKKEDKPEDAVEETPESEEPAGKDIPLEELIKNETGIGALLIDNIEVSERDCYLQVILDDAFIPSYVSPKLKQRKLVTGDTQDLVIRELGWSQITFQLSEKPNRGKKDEIIAVAKIGTLNLLKKSYLDYGKVQIKKGERVVATVSVRMRYFPLLMELSPSESVNNMGILSGEIIKADNVPAADRSGYSDPYTLIYLNGEKAFKTKTVKKTLNPVWNEKFEVEVLSRTAADFVFEVYDWDIGPGDDDFLGRVKVDLTKLEPMTPLNLTLPLVGESGTLSVRLLFKPSYVTRRVDSSGLGSTFANGTANKLVGSALGGAGAVAGGATGVVGAAVGGVGHLVGGGLKGGANLLRGTFKRNKNNQDMTRQDSYSNASVHSLDVPGGAPGSPSSPRNHRRSVSMMSDISVAPSHAGEMVNGSITILSGSGFNGSINIRTCVAGPKEKEVHKTKNVKGPGGDYKFDETFSFKAPADGTLIFKVREHKSLGRNEDIGQEVVHLAEIESGRAVVLPITGGGQVTVSVSF